MLDLPSPVWKSASFTGKADGATEHEAVAVSAEPDSEPDYRFLELQFGLRQAVGTRTLDALLENKGRLYRSILDYACERLAVHGVEVTGVGV